MLLKVLNDLCSVTTILVELVNDLITELEHQNTINSMDVPEKESDELKPAIEKYKERAEEANSLLDTIEYNSRRI